MTERGGDTALYETGSVAPVQLVHRLLAEAARDRGLNAYATSGLTVVMCAVCHPDQPVMLPLNGRMVEWRDTMRRSLGRCEWPGAVRIALGRMVFNPRAVRPVDEMLDDLFAESCCHDPDLGLDSWDWQTDLAARLSEAVALDPDAQAWAEQWSAEQGRLATERAELVLRGEVVEAAAHLSHRERVRALFTVLRGAGWPVEQRDALVLLECGHTEGGRFAKIGWQVDINGLPEPTSSCCTEPHRTEPEVSLADLLAEYQRVAALPPEERTRYAPLRATPRKGGRAAAAQAARETARITGDRAVIVAWLDGEDLPPSERPRVPRNAPHHRAWGLVRDLTPRPTQTAVREAQSWRQRQEVTGSP